jgi:2'-5' RNA ligase
VPSTLPTYGVAITIPAPWGSALQDLRGRFGDPMARAIPSHVTLLPPTPVDDATLDAFVEHLEKVAATHPPFEMVLSGTGTFRPVSPVVFVQVSRGISSCERLESAVRSGPVERRLDFNYHPHVTVAHHLDDDALDAAFDDLADFRCAFPVTAIDLFQNGRDAVWRPRQSFPLTGG